MALLSVVIPTYNRTQLLLKRAIPSVLKQDMDHMELEIIVVGDGEGPTTRFALEAFQDPRISYRNLDRPDYPKDDGDRWGVIGLAARNWGYDHASGDYIMGLDDDDALITGSIKRLHEKLLEENADIAYGKSVAFNEKLEIIGRYGFYPPKHFAFCEGAWLMKHDLGYRFDLEAYKRGIPGDGDRIDRMVADGLRFAFVDEFVHNYYPNRHPRVKVAH